MVYVAFTLLTVRHAILQVERVVAKRAAAMSAGEAIWMPLSVHGVQAVLRLTKNN